MGVKNHTLTFGMWSDTSTSPPVVLQPFCRQHHCHLRSSPKQHTTVGGDRLVHIGQGTAF